MRPNSYHPISIKPKELKKLEFFDFDKILEAAPAVIDAIGSIGNIFGGGKPEDTSDVGFQNFMAQKKAAEAAEARRQQSEADRKETIYWIVGGVIIAILMIGGTVLVISKKK